MERLDPAGKSFYSPASKSRKKVKKTRSKRLSFASLLEGESGEEVGKTVFGELDLSDEASLEEMLDEIHSVGDRVRENANQQTIGRYRHAVRSFMRHVLSHALEVDVKSSSPNILRQKKFTLVRVIDRKLERLASGVLMNQQETLEILARIDEITGLLVDLIS